MSEWSDGAIPGTQRFGRTAWFGKDKGANKHSMTDASVVLLWVR
jgi:hypothetical protein